MHIRQKNLELSYNKVIIFLSVFLTITNIAILLDVPFLRQLGGFILLTFLPGILFIYIVKVNNLSFLQKMVLAIGCSIAFLLIGSIVINYVFLLFGNDQPLKTINVLISLDILLIILLLRLFLLNKSKILIVKLKPISLSVHSQIILLITSLFPLLGIIGMRMMIQFDNNILVIILLLLIAIDVIVIALFHRKIQVSLYPYCIFVIGLSILLLMPFRSNNIIIGADSGQELYYFMRTLNSSQWGIYNFSSLDSAVSISILPTIYQSILHINPEMLFKMLYAVLFSISPITIYIICSKYLTPFFSFLASFFFIAQLLFISSPIMARVSIALIFFGLLIMVLILDKINNTKRYVLITLFITSIILSHYTTAYVILTICIFAWVINRLVPRLLTKKLNIFKLSGVTPRKNINSGFINFYVIALFSLLIYIWYGLITKSPFSAGVTFFRYAYLEAANILKLNSRGGTIQSLFGQNSALGALMDRSYLVFTWLIIGLIFAGLVIIFIKKREIIYYSINEKINKNLLSSKINLEYYSLIISSVLLLAVSVAVPFVSKQYDSPRLLFTLAIILSPCAVIGGYYLSRSLKLPSYSIFLIITVIYFLFNCGVIFQLAGIPKNILLSSTGNAYDISYVHDQEKAGAVWLGEHRLTYAVYTSSYSTETLMGYGLIPPTDVNGYAFVSDDKIQKSGGYIFLGYTATVYGEIITNYETVIEYSGLSKYPSLFNGRNMIYNNGGSEILRNS